MEPDRLSPLNSTVGISAIPAHLDAGGQVQEVPQLTWKQVSDFRVQLQALAPDRAAEVLRILQMALDNSPAKTSVPESSGSRV